MGSRPVANLNVNVTGGGASPKENNDLARQLGRELQPALRDLVLRELRIQMQPNGMLDR